MNKVINNVVKVPCKEESIRFTSCFVSMIMRAEEITDDEQDFYCSSQNGICIRCGKCDDFIPIEKLHNELYYLYTIVSGYGFLQFDLSNNEHMSNGWDHTSQVLLEEFDDYIHFVMEFAGYEYETIQPSESKILIHNKIKKSINCDVPVLVRLKNQKQWVLITGYDNDDLLGLDGAQSYWGQSEAITQWNADGLFIMSDWYESIDCIIVLGERKPPSYTIDDVLKRGIKIMQSMQKNGYYKNSVEFMRNNSNFENLNDNQLLDLRNRIIEWIEQPIDIRSMTGFALNPIRKQENLAIKKAVALNLAHSLCWTVHDVLWIAWFTLGKYKKGNKLDWAKGLKDERIRNVVTDCMDFTNRHDEMILSALLEAYR